MIFVYILYSFCTNVLVKEMRVQIFVVGKVGFDSLICILFVCVAGALSEIVKTHQLKSDSHLPKKFVLFA